MTLSPKTAKALHGLVITAATAALTFVATSLPALFHLPVGIRGVVEGIGVAVVASVAGYGLRQLQAPEVKP